MADKKSARSKVGGWRAVSNRLALIRRATPISYRRRIVAAVYHTTCHPTKDVKDAERNELLDWLNENPPQGARTGGDIIEIEAEREERAEP